MISRALMALALAGLMAGTALAQRGGGGGGGGFGGGGGRGPQVDRSAVLAAEFKLTPDQKTQIESLFDDAQKQTAPLVQQAMAEQNNMLNALTKGQDSAAAVQKLTAIRVQIKMLEVDAMGKAMATFDDKQKQKAARFYDLVAGTFASRNWRWAN
jgi:Spy/CpxP family protein refolding chaperone